MQLAADEPPLVRAAENNLQRPKGRANVLDFYFDIARGFALNHFVPHTAILLWDKCVAASLRPPTDRGLAAAAFLIAHKLIDNKIITVDNLAEYTLADPNVISNTELLLLKRMPTLVPENIALRVEFCRRALPPSAWLATVQLFDRALYRTRAPLRALARPSDTTADACAARAQSTISRRRTALVPASSPLASSMGCSCSPTTRSFCPLQIVC